MAERLIRSDTLTQLAEAIRIKTDTTDAMTPAQMAERMLQAGFGGFPAHHDAEAVKVLDKIRRVRDTGANVLVFGVITDTHVDAAGGYERLSKVSTRHAAFALETVGRLAQCDFLVHLGDSGWASILDTKAAGYEENCLRAAFAAVPSYRLVGDHDQSVNRQQVYALTGARNDYKVAAATALRGYGYIDLTAQKVRVIMLNTSDYISSVGGYDLSYEQKDFLIRALDLSRKTDAEQWQILLLSHFPLDYPDASSYGTRGDVRTILSSYASGLAVLVSINSAYAEAEGEDPTAYETYSQGYLTRSYMGKNDAPVIANFHGHVHNASFGPMDGSGILRVASPNACFYLENGSVGQYTADAAWPKTEGTAQDTAVTFYAIDLDAKVIHSFAYGAGEDREIVYG